MYRLPMFRPRSHLTNQSKASYAVVCLVVDCPLVSSLAEFIDIMLFWEDNFSTKQKVGLFAPSTREVKKGTTILGIYFDSQPLGNCRFIALLWASAQAALHKARGRMDRAASSWDNYLHCAETDVSSLWVLKGIVSRREICSHFSWGRKQM